MSCTATFVVHDLYFYHRVIDSMIPTTRTAYRGAFFYL